MRGVALSGYGQGKQSRQWQCTSLFQGDWDLSAKVKWEEAFFAEESTEEALYDDYMAGVTFRDADLLLGTPEHNRPLYVTWTSQGSTINRILIDAGSSVNLITLRKLRHLELDVQDLSKEKIVIQGRSVKSASQLVEALKSDGAIPLSHGVFPQSQSSSVFPHMAWWKKFLAL